MKLVNTTPYDSKDLKTFIYFCGKKLRGGRKITIDLLVIARPSYTGRFHGLGWLHKVWVHKYNHQGYLIKLTIPTQKSLNEIEQKSFKRNVAHLVIHELMHCQGYNHWGTHKIEKRNGYGWGADALAFADNLTLGDKYTIIKPKLDIKIVRHKHAIEKLKEVTSKIKRYTTLQKKWRAKVKYYESITSVS